jgi:tRNA threonylcarbamoyladenosine biosynthesis protein TsaB
MSIAVCRGAQVWRHRAPGAAQASAALIPAIMSLLSQAGLRLADLDAIAFGRGPGSFTGLRTACSVAQGLGFGAGVPLLGVETLMAVAEQAREQEGSTRVLAVLDARMDQVYAGAYEFDSGAWRRLGEFSLGAPEALQVPPGWTLAGNAVGAYGERLPQVPRVSALPDAAAMLRLAPDLLASGQAVAADQALPLYIRDKVAQTTGERAALRAAPPSPA